MNGRKKCRTSIPWNTVTEGDETLGGQHTMQQRGTKHDACDNSDESPENYAD